MQATDLPDVPTRTSDDVLRLRVDVYTTLAEAKGYRSRAAQARWHGLARSTMFRVLAGGNPTAQTAAAMARHLGVGFEVIWERVA